MLATSTLTNANAITATGIYYIKGTIPATGCEIVQPVTATINSLPNVVTSPATICFPGTLDLTLASITSGSSGGLTFTQWNNASATSALTNASAITVTGTYYIRGTIPATGCSVTQPVAATINPLPNVVTNSTAVCFPGTVDLTAAAVTSGSTGGLTFTQWNNVPATSALTNSGSITATGTYYIKGTIPATGCSVTQPVTATINPLPTVIITAPAAVCVPFTIDITVPGITSAGSAAGLSYTQWNNSIATSALANPNAITATGIYYIKGTVPITGCAVVKPVTATVNPLPAVAAITGPSAVCLGSAITLTDATLGGVWSSSNTGVATINSSGFLSGVSAGTLTVTYTYTNGNGCTSSVSSGKTVNTLPVVAPIAGATKVCLSNSASVTNPTPTGTWSSSNNTIATVNAGGLVTGVSLGAVTIAYTVTNSNGCVNSSAATMNVAAIPAIPTVTASGPLVFCVGSTVVLTSSSGNGNQWYRDGVLLTAQTNQTYTAAASGNYTVQVTNGNGCVSNSPSLATTVTVNPLPAATIRGTTAVCQNAATPLITFTGSNATAPYTFTYKINGGANQTITTVSGNSVTLPAPTGTAGTFIYTLESVKEGSATACSNTATGSATVTVNPLPTATISGTIAVCQNAAAPLITFTGSNATAPYTFTYTINGGANQNIITTTGNSANVTALTGVAGVFAYTLVSVKEAGATACSIAVNATATVVVNPLPTGIIQTPAASYICAGIPQILTASTADNYQWYLDQNIINGATAASYPATVAGNYSVQLISKDGCVNNAANSVQLILYLKPVLSFIPDKQCLNSPVTFLNRSSFASSGNIDWQWDLGDGNGSSLFSPSHIYGAEGMYTVSLTANNLSCPNLTEKNTAAYFIESPIPGIRYAAITAVVNKPVTLTARPFGAKYLWQPFNSLSNYTVQSPVATLATQQEYTVEIISAEGCVTVDTVLVKLFPGSEIYAPQGFTPNGDGQNDSFYPILVRANKLNYFKVFNRWGNLLFQTNDATPANGWNGKYNGTDQPAGTYTWIAEAVDADGNIIKRSGNVLLLR